MHLLVILAIALIVLGPKRLPETGRGLGAAMRNFRQAVAAPETPESRRVEPSADQDAER